MLYKLLDHTADLRIQFFGKTKKKLIKNSAIALSQVAFETDPANINTCNCKKVKITVKEDEFDQLYIDFLREILFKINTMESFFVDVKFLDFAERHVAAYCFYVKNTATTVKNEIKAVTYNDFDISKDKEDWSAKVTFDI